MTTPHQVATSSIRFRGLFAPEEPAHTGDRRMFARNSLTNRQPPLPVMFTRSRGERHIGSVAVARLESITYEPGRGWIGEGAFLDPRIVPEVVEAVYLAQQGVSRPSVDLEPDLTFEVVPHPSQPEEYMRRVLNGKTMGFTMVPHAAFEGVDITVTEQSDADVLMAAGVDLNYDPEDQTFAVNTSSWRSMAVAPRQTPFKFREAINRLLEWSGGQPSQFARAFLYRDPRLDPGSREAYRLPIADVVNGKLTLIPRAVFSAATFLSGGHGGVRDVQEAELQRIRTVVTRIYDMLRESYNDPRVRPPWQRGGRQGADNTASVAEGEEMPTYTYTFDTETGELEVTGLGTTSTDATEVTFQDGDSGGDCGNLDTPDAGDLNTAARECAARRGWAMEGGRYPIRSKEMHGASDLSKAILAVGRGEGGHDEIRQHIMKRARSLGLADQIPENWTSSGSKGGDDSSATEPETFEQRQPSKGAGDSEADCPEGQIRNSEGACVESDEAEPQVREREDRRTSPRRYEVLTASGTAGTTDPAVFSDPNLSRATPLTVTDNNHVYGHLATWSECHMGIGNRCVTAPRSATGYAMFKTGEVVCNDGSRVPVGKITLGTGHADPNLGLIPATEHYDNSGAVVAVVNCGEDRFGIWVHGALVAGLDESRIEELRRSPLSGDWRRYNGNLELVAALAVVVPGFPVLRASAEPGSDEEIIETMLATGSVTEPGPVDPEQERRSRWHKIEELVRAQRAKELLEA